MVPGPRMPRASERAGIPVISALAFLLLLLLLRHSQCSPPLAVRTRSLQLDLLQEQPACRVSTWHPFSLGSQASVAPQCRRLTIQSIDIFVRGHNRIMKASRCNRPSSVAARLASDSRCGVDGVTG